MDQFSKDFGGLHSPDDFDLLSLGREMARRKGQAAEPAPAQSPEKTGTV